MKPRFCLLIFLSGISLCLGSYTRAHTWAAPPPAYFQSGNSGTEFSGDRSSPSEDEVLIPGPLRSFLRMAGISQQVSPDEVLPLLARNVVLHGYQSGRPTEFLILLSRYVRQAEELATLAGDGGMIRISNCDDVKPLLRILGYRVRQNCGQSSTSLVTADPQRAFSTIDSGFPLSELEEALQRGGPFTYSFAASPVPVLFNQRDWTTENKKSGAPAEDFLDTILRNPTLARLYWALSRMDPGSRTELARNLGLRKLLPFAAVLDMYGGQICVQSGRVIVPGGKRAESDWKDLVGASPDSPAEFVLELLKKDHGWLAAYFDALSHANQTQQEHFSEAHRLKRFYEGFRSPGVSGDAASRLVFRQAPALLLLVTRLSWDPTGEPHVPGNLQTWGEILQQRADGKVVRGWGKRSSGWQHPDQLVEAMFALSRVETELGPLQAYVFLCELDSRRSPGERLSPQTVLLLADKFSEFSDQYLIFSEFPDLTDASIARFLGLAESLGKIPNHTLRGNAMGMFQANVGLWQILARQGQIANTDLDNSWREVIEPFAKISSAAQLFDAGRNSLGQLLRFATGKSNASQDAIIDLLAGPHQTSLEGQRMHQEVASKIRSVLDGQRLVSLDTLLALGEGLQEMTRGIDVSASLAAAAGELREFEMPRPIFTGSERTRWAEGTYNNRHTELQMRTDLAKLIKSPRSRAELEAARGQVAPFLRDTLVGLNYAYYEPPGAQALHHNPLFVRSHDFSGETVMGIERLWQAPQVFGAGYPAGGGAHLVGSLADLAYVLSEVEEDFLAPQSVQALIWKQLVPTLLTDATVPRWWDVSRNELHAVALYQRAGEELLADSADNQELYNKVMPILSDRMMPQNLTRLEQALRQRQLDEVFAQLVPADTFYLAAEFRQRFPSDAASWGPAGKELESLSRLYPAEVSWERLSRDFGVPHAVLAQSYARELLNVKPFPALAGNGSRLMAESWDSNNLYWARLADELDYAPVTLNWLVPELTRRMVEKIFATDLEDWPAILRAMRETGEEFRQGKIALLPTKEATSQP